MLTQKKLEKEAWMSYPSVDCTLDFKKSCTKDDAVAKLLGWLGGPICYEAIEIGEEGVSADQLKHMETLVFSLAAHLKNLREEALYKASDAVESNSPEDVQQELLNAVLDIEDLIKVARRYILDLEEELDKGELSELVIDKPVTESSGAVHITLKSLDRWAQKKYGIEILDEGISPTINSSLEDSQHTNVNQSKPWEKVNLKDPPAASDWYPAARYFAREVIREQPTVLANRNLLALKVRDLMAGAKVYKRGGKKQPDPSTIKKAFVNVVL